MNCSFNLNYRLYFVKLHSIWLSKQLMSFYIRLHQRPPSFALQSQTLMKPFNEYTLLYWSFVLFISPSFLVKIISIVLANDFSMNHITSMESTHLIWPLYILHDYESYLGMSIGLRRRSCLRSRDIQLHMACILWSWDEMCRYLRYKCLFYIFLRDWWIIILP